MWERTRFVRYALKFERAFKTDDWAGVRECFAPNARYIVEGSGTEYDGEVRGPDAITALFKRMLDAVDRKYDRRIPRPSGWWRIVDGELRIPWTARYVLGTRETTLHGESRCRFRDGKIIELSDRMDPAECAAWVSMIR